tara:strand:+ start:210 stop:605 length:396 start_codon:yes stop_codon:yes gene_type:complete
MTKPKWNKLKKFCLKHDLTEERVIVYLERCLKVGIKKPDGCKKQWILNRFDLYAKERIKQKNNNYRNVWGSKKIDAVRKVVDSEKYQDLHKKYYVETKHNGVKILTQLVSEPRQKEKLLKAFNDNGEYNII